jgi:FtsH-binding integral membrane protein
MRSVQIAFFIVRFTIFLLCMMTFLAVGTAAVHELGHYLAAKWLGCPEVSITLASDHLAYTEMSCLDEENVGSIIFAGLIFTTLLSVLLFFSTKDMLRLLGAAIGAIGVIIASLDIAGFYQNALVGTIVSIVGYLLLSFIAVRIALAAFKEFPKL